jgi:hypothetical protein
LSSQTLPERFPLLFSRDFKARNLSDAISGVDGESLAAEYFSLKEEAPRRSNQGKRYFVGHTGITSSRGSSNRLEEHCAIALLRLDQWWPGIGDDWRLLDYQVPLKARQADAGVGKIDLLGITRQGRIILVELKVENESGGRSDAPPVALMEGLRYAAMVEADLEAIATEIEQAFGETVLRDPPIIKLLAPKNWWHRWITLEAAGDWTPEFSELAAKMAAATGTEIEFLAFEDVKTVYGVDGQAPSLERAPSLYRVSFEGQDRFGEAL